MGVSCGVLRQLSLVIAVERRDLGKVQGPVEAIGGLVNGKCVTQPLPQVSPERSSEEDELLVDHRVGVTVGEAVATVFHGRVYETRCGPLAISIHESRVGSAGDQLHEMVGVKVVGGPPGFCVVHSFPAAQEAVRDVGGIVAEGQQDLLHGRAPFRWLPVDGTACYCSSYVDCNPTRSRGLGESGTQGVENSLNTMS